MKKLVSLSIAAVALFGMLSTAHANEGLYNKKGCKNCHGFGPGPKLGNKADWAPRIARGMPELVANTLKGTAKGMPPKGGRADVTDDEIKSIVQFMVDSVK